MTASRDDGKAIRILVVDDHAIVRRGLVDMLKGEPGFEVVGEGADGAAAVDLFHQLEPDVLITDLDMPRMDGLEVTRRIRATFPDARILVLTVHGGEDAVARCLAAGALGYLLKTADTEEIVAAVRAVHAGRRRIAPALGEKLADRMAAPSLTDREMDVLRLMAEGLDNHAIADHLAIGVGTVKWYITSIFAKLDVTDRTQAVVTAVRRGLVRIT